MGDSPLFNELNFINGIQWDKQSRILCETIANQLKSEQVKLELLLEK